MNAFLYKPSYMLLIAMIMAASNIFGWEFMAFYAYMLIGLYMTLFAPDCFPAVPMFCCGYMLFSAGNNPASNYGETIFSVRANVIQFIIIVAVIVLSLSTRFFFEILVVRRKHKRMPALTFGFVALGISYLLSGIFTEGYGGKELSYAVLQIVSLCFTYFYFYYTIDWGKRNIGDCAAILTTVGAGLFLEIIAMYLKPQVIEAIKNNCFDRGMLASGWGVYNNVGGMMAMLMPAPFYFACVKKNGWLYLLLASVFLIGVFLTQSRGAMLAGGVVYAACCVFVTIYTPKERKIENILTLALVALGIGVVALAVFLMPEETIMGSTIATGTYGNGRMDIYKAGWQQFLDAPIFGKGFYAPFEDREQYYSILFEHQYGWASISDDYFIPPRYHNTIIQLLASGGIVALVAYGYHRLQTIFLFIKKPTVHKIFLGLAICAHLIASLLDCHFFNLGPGLTYGIILLCTEMLSDKASEEALSSKKVAVEGKTRAVT